MPGFILINVSLLEHNQFHRFLLGLCSKVKAKLDELLANDIIEPVVGVSTSWVSPLVVVVQDNGDIRQTIDMSQANKAFCESATLSLP